ncbi:NAD-dependent epimerase/dehydratase family protein [Arthrospira platensis]|uniref:NAD-dependent epimerase/dehydratase family protein n=1 Tax=Limnospira TaxID=2596745 RepID=UPI0001C39463|nr:NAD-dependent epimerase/dehydratase family protein [Arthrospira platensis]KDR56063.1 epimerase [Arthrospira platensis str. Paraca]MBD2667925.1 NAD-dependent epimerase/dehydratase family protein [Arthrospira platensis FACHB-439]MBD2708937.1 NAD-dependent epimerase/dehydratase family protein [Arthrospira platensis FACHB-835]MDF2208742.1 NAD-dependent epimerase/dehydratase family protein [Arthrospira platensis NCB002]MDT9309011.1 NAD-dependent epimerase/dehydratase family protein [Limnospira s
MKHLVTGGSGFLGNLIARRLSQRGEEVKILDIWEDPTRPQDIEYINCDIRDRQGVAAAMKGVDIVHHNVALVPLTKSGKKFWEVNVEGSRIAAEEAAQAGVSSFIHMSSSALFGDPQCPITNQTQPQPVEIYGRAKLAGELAVRQVCDRQGLPLIVIRPRTILGEGRLGIFQILFEWIKEGRNVYVIGDGNIKFQFIHALDLMDAYLLALDLGKPGIYNVGSDRFGTLREGLEHLISYAGTDSQVKSLPTTLTIGTLRLLDIVGLSPLAPWHYLTYHKEFYFDVQPLLNLGWQPQYSNDEMFQESYDWFQQNYDKIQAEKAGSAHRKPVKEKILWLLKQLS